MNPNDFFAKQLTKNEQKRLGKNIQLEKN